MHSSTSSYIELQNLFKAQFNDDLARYKLALNATLKSIDLAEDAIPNDEVESFARNVSAVDIVQGTSLAERKGINSALTELYSE